MVLVYLIVNYNNPVFSIDNNNKYFPSNQPAYEWFLKIMWHWRLEYDAENTALITGISYIFKYIQIKNCSFKL